jgi:D-lactate dehydrogenase (cytochrome)
VLAACASDAQAVGVTAALRHEAHASWRGEGPLDVSAIEYMDSMSLSYVQDEAFSRAGLSRRGGTWGLLLIQVEIGDDELSAMQRLNAIFEQAGVGDDAQAAAPGDERGAARLFELREAVPAAVNARIAATKAAVHPDIQKTAGDLIAPFDRVAESIALYRACFERRGLRYAIWGHLSDGNLHPNVLPESLDQVTAGREAILEAARGVIAMGGAPLAEHGVGRSALKQELLRELYGDRGVDEMRAVKRALDPDWKLAPGVLFPQSNLRTGLEQQADGGRRQSRNQQPEGGAASRGDFASG